MMKRIDALKRIYKQLDSKLIVTNMGAVAAELYSLGHKKNFFYLEHSMGLASSVGLGLALSKPRIKIIVFDGDGSVLMNLGTFSTIARYNPKNLTHVIFDNESLLSVGGFPTATSTGTNLKDIAISSGIKNAYETNDIDEFESLFKQNTNLNNASVLVSKVEAKGPEKFTMDLGLIENKIDFKRHINSLKEN
jgi:sulfopyruvate decarboxylase subunit beta